MSSPIGWTDKTVNPGLYGCTAVSPACENCYAAGMAVRLATMPHTAERYEGAARRVHGRAAWTGKVKVRPQDIAPAFGKLPKRPKRCEVCNGEGAVPHGDGPLMVRAMRECPGCSGVGRRGWRVFITSMSDIFHKNAPFDFVDACFEEMAIRPHIDHQLLTKRVDRMAAYAAHRAKRGLGWPANVWAGCTTEDQTRLNERLAHLKAVPAVVRFLSCEPLLGPLDVDLNGIHWIIGGGESGSRARPSNPAWFRSLRDQCKAAGVPFYMKQMWQEGREMVPIPDDLQIREFPHTSLLGGPR